MKLPIGAPVGQGHHLSRPRDPWDAFLKQKPVEKTAMRRGVSKRRGRVNDTRELDGKREIDR